MSSFIELSGCLVLNILHLFLYFYLNVKVLKLKILKFVDNLSSLLISRKRKCQLDWELIEESVKNYSKIPQHLTFALGHEHVSYDDLIQIIIWTIPTGIPTLSFYDHKNELNADKLHDAFLRKFSRFNSHVKWGVSFSKNLQTEGELNVSKQCVRVNVLTERHGRSLLIDSIKDLCQNEEVTPTDQATTEATLDNVMSSKLLHCGSPDFFVISGNVCTTYGFSPWHLTFTEFLTILSYQLITTTDFIRILGHFSRREQKFGQ